MPWHSNAALRVNGSGVNADKLALARQAMSANPALACALADRAIELAEHAANMSAAAEAAMCSYQCYVRCGDLQTAEKRLLSAFTALESCGQGAHLGRVFKCHSMLFVMQDRISLALSAATKALGYPDLSPKDRAFTYATIAMCVGQLVDLPHAERIMSEHALIEADRSADPSTIVACYSRAAGLMHVFACWSVDIPHYSTFGMERPVGLLSKSAYLQRAQEYLTVCAQHSAELEPVERSWALAQAGVVTGFSEGWLRAKINFDQAFSLVHAKFPRAEVSALVSAGMTCRIGARLDDAERYLLRAREIPAASEPHSARVINHELFHLYRELGRTSEALLAFETFTSLEAQKSRLSASWVTDTISQRRYGEQFDIGKTLAAALHAPRPRALRRADTFVEQNLNRALKLEQVASHAGVSPRSLQTLFRKHHGTTAGAYIRERRMQRAHDLLTAESKPVGIVADSIGYTNQANFARDYRRRFGCTPSSANSGSSKGQSSDR